jgi:hypothetical protein
MSDSIKASLLGGIIGIILTGLATLIIFRVSELKPDYTLAALVAVYSPLIVWSFNFINKLRKDELSMIINEINKKADAIQTDIRIKDMDARISDHVVVDNLNIERLFKTIGDIQIQIGEVHKLVNIRKK